MCHNNCSTSGQEQEYLVYFCHRHLDFRLPEIEALLDGAGYGGAVKDRWRQPFGGRFYSPFWYLRLPSDYAAQKIAERSILLKVHRPGPFNSQISTNFGCRVQQIAQKSYLPTHPPGKVGSCWACNCNRVASYESAAMRSSQGFLELWGEGQTWQELEAAVACFPQERKQPWLSASVSMKV
jgi:hypothetical protein